MIAGRDLDRLRQRAREAVEHVKHSVPPSVYRQDDKTTPWVVVDAEELLEVIEWASTGRRLGGRET